mmetsp:Transcript_59989/g.104995  ORF Transcript_59989/g.104995 Transcript_59989/m.104995 type:complete len:543 (+) Transcript_59989:123-1751(+)
MKVTATVKVKTSSEPNSVHEIIVGDSETAASVKEKVSNKHLIPFPKQELFFDGQIIEDGSKLSEHGVTEGSSLDVVVDASESALAQQLSELLQARDLSADELGLLYCYKHGVSVNQALKLIGHEGSLKDFLEQHKTFLMENGTVTLIRQSTALKPFSVASEIEQILKASDSDMMDIKELCSKFVQKFGVSLSSIVGTRPSEFLAKEKRFTIHGRGVVSLKSSKVVQAKPKAQATSDAISAPPGLANLAEPSEKAGQVDVQQYLDLHDRICSRSFQSRITQVVNDVVKAVSEALFLNIHNVVIGGSVGKGTVISGTAHAEVVLFVSGLPKAGQEKWLLPLLRSVAGILQGDFGGGHSVEGVRVSEESVQMEVKGLVSVDLCISPVFASYAETIQVLGNQGPDARKHYAPALAKERTQFIARQPSQAKVTMRLMKWWRDQQEWSSKLVRPSDEVLELMVVYSAIQTKPPDQKAAIANLMSLLSGFDKLRIVWSNYYTKDDVWAPLLRQRPLLMDPTNPFINIADPQVFDPRELMNLAQTTRFFW